MLYIQNRRVAQQMLAAKQKRRLRPKPLHTTGTLRNRAINELLVMMPATTSWISAMQVQDYYRVGSRAWVRLVDEDGFERIEPVGSPLERYLDEYVAAAHIADDPTSPLFRYLHGDKISRLGITPSYLSNMIQKRAASLQRRFRLVERPKRGRAG